MHLLLLISILAVFEPDGEELYQRVNLVRSRVGQDLIRVRVRARVRGRGRSRSRGRVGVRA